MRIAFTLFAGSNWLGGYNYLLNLCRVINAYSNGRLVPVMFVGEDIPEEDTLPFRKSGCEVVVSAGLNKDQKTSRLLHAILTGKDTVSERLFLNNKIDAVFEHATYFGWRFSLPTIAWLVDFQHLYFPEMFSKKAFWRRQLGMRLQIMSGRTIMVSSEMAQRDCEKFFGLPPDKVHVVCFSVPAPPVQELDSTVIRERYGLPQHFFHLPNQFWKHKNHLLVLKALTMLKDTEVFIVTTGRNEDLRHPEYFKEVQEFINSEGLEGSIKILGVVPYADMVNLMLASLAVINPSLFEGWSTTVEEARSLRVPLLLSDIPVHREQMGLKAQYFPVDAPEKLAELLRQFLTKGGQREAVHQSTVENDNRVRLEKFSTDFESAVVASIARH